MLESRAMGSASGWSGGRVLLANASMASAAVASPFLPCISSHCGLSVTRVHVVMNTREVRAEKNVSQRQPGRSQAARLAKMAPAEKKCAMRSAT